MATRFFVYLTGLLAGISMASPVVAQTQVDLRTQSRNIDFGAAPSTRPLKTGTALPSSCLVGDMFFSSSSPADKNLYGCTSLNTWTPQAEVISPSGVANYVLAFTNQTALSISAAMHGFDSPNLLVTCFDNSAPANMVPPSGVTVDSSSFLVTISFTGPRSGRCVLNAPGTAYVSGEGIIQNGTQFSIDTVTTPSFLKGQALMTGWMLVAHTCGARTFPLVGAALLDTLAPGWPPDLNPALSGTMLVSGAGVVSVRLCNGTANDVVVPARTFAAAILKSF